MMESVGRGFRRVAFVIGFGLGLIVALTVIVTFVPRSLRPFYLLGWILVLVPIMFKHSEIPQIRRVANRDPYRSVLAVVEMMAIFTFGLVTFRALLASSVPGIALGAVGIMVVIYDLSD